MLPMHLVHCCQLGLCIPRGFVRGAWRVILFLYRFGRPLSSSFDRVCVKFTVACHSPSTSLVTRGCYLSQPNRSLGSISHDSGQDSQSEYSKAQYEASASRKDEFFARKMRVRPDTCRTPMCLPVYVHRRHTCLWCWTGM